ncbi:putative WD40-repeat-containing domain superfamily [Plasmopara halstedii]
MVTLCLSYRQIDRGAAVFKQRDRTGAPFDNLQFWEQRCVSFDYNGESTCGLLEDYKLHSSCSTSKSEIENVRKIQAKAKISFSGLVINHITGSPHSEAELASVTVDGTVRYWDPEGGIRTITKEAYTQTVFYAVNTRGVRKII